MKEFHRTDRLLRALQQLPPAKMYNADTCTVRVENRYLYKFVKHSNNWYIKSIVDEHAKTEKQTA